MSLVFSSTSFFYFVFRDIFFITKVGVPMGSMSSWVRLVYHHGSKSFLVRLVYMWFHFLFEWCWFTIVVLLPLWLTLVYHQGSISFLSEVSLLLCFNILFFIQCPNDFGLRGLLTIDRAFPNQGIGPPLDDVFLLRWSRHCLMSRYPLVCPCNTDFSTRDGCSQTGSCLLSFAYFLILDY